MYETRAVRRGLPRSAGGGREVWTRWNVKLTRYVGRFRSDAITSTEIEEEGRPADRSAVPVPEPLVPRLHLLGRLAHLVLSAELRHQVTPLWERQERRLCSRTWNGPALQELRHMHREGHRSRRPACANCVEWRLVDAHRVDVQRHRAQGREPDERNLGSPTRRTASRVGERWGEREFELPTTRNRRVAGAGKSQRGTHQPTSALPSVKGDHAECDAPVSPPPNTPPGGGSFLPR
jgi:hypothetical protein